MTQFTITDNQFNPNPHIKLPLPSEHSVLHTSMIYFDKEGYELNALEREYYNQNRVPLGNHLYHVCHQEDWILCDMEPKHGAFFDHCMLVTRWDYQDAARDQIERHVVERPVLNKLLKIKPKYGVDLSLDYLWPNGDIMELFHIELDRYTVEEVNEWKERIEQFLLKHDWDDVAKDLLSKKDEWVMLNSNDQTDWKCQYLGLPRAYDNYKVI